MIQIWCYEAANQLIKVENNLIALGFTSFIYAINIVKKY